MLRKLLVGLVFSSFLALSAQADTDSAPVQPDHATAASSLANAVNWFDSNTWHDAAGHVQPGYTTPFNPVDPASWMKWVDPTNHSKMHMAFTNPAQYVQFMQPQFYMQFANPMTYMKWFDPQSFALMMNPATWMYWMQPGAYVHVMNPANYLQMMNPQAYTGYFDMNTYMSWFNPAAYQAGFSATPSSANPFDWMNWMNLFNPAAMANTAPATAEQQ